MKIYLEANARFGAGYQVRIDTECIGSDKKEVRCVLAESPYTLYEAVHISGEALDRFNELTGSGHQLYEVLWLTQDGVEANAGRDIASARLARELRSGMRKYVELKVALEGGSDDEVT